MIYVLIVYLLLCSAVSLKALEKMIRAKNRYMSRGSKSGLETAIEDCDNVVRVTDL